MFSVENFYYTLHENLIKPVKGISQYFYPFGSTDTVNNLLLSSTNFDTKHFYLPGRCHKFIYYDQEPILDTNPNLWMLLWETDIKFNNVLVHSEKSDDVTKLCKEYQFAEWYYFFHGFAALSWYDDYKYVSHVDTKFDKVFINLNRLTTGDRSYRLYMVSQMIQRDLMAHGHVSLNITDPNQPTWKEEIFRQDSKLSKPARKVIYETLKDVTESYVVDETHPEGHASAHAGPEELRLNQSALWHVVSETVFYYDKLHLTEKIFKPIVSHRPFILVGAKGNLAYLKSYGFKTFDKWIDESYDTEPDNDKRMDMVLDQIEKLCKLTPSELDAMYEDMHEVLEYNFEHFYGKFKEIIVDEMLTNFKNMAIQWNNGRIDGRTIDLRHIDFDKVKTRFLR